MPGDIQPTTQKTPALIERPQITPDNTLDLHPTWDYAIVTRTLSPWLRNESSRTIQAASTKDHGISLPCGTVLGHLTALISIGRTQLSRVVAGPDVHRHSRVEIQRVLPSALRKSTLPNQEKLEVLDICAKNSPVFSLMSKELGRCTVTGATFPLKPVT